MSTNKCFGVSSDGNGWICFRTGQAELLIGEDDVVDLDVISSCSVLYEKGMYWM